ncbi:MAG TPA: DUF6272 family protein [Polyangiaceae bacterium]|nr:DUF6272 family protein [Polyangiaceae bacterium]
MTEQRPTRPPERSLKLLHGGKAVEDARRMAELAVTCCDTECRQAASMAAWELAENLLKYGASDPTKSAGTIAISVDKNLVRVRTTNTVHSPNDARRVQETVSKISSSPSARDLYRERLLELFGDPAQHRAQLGLLRIAFEGSFKLSCSFEPPLLEIVAERSCAGQ